MADFLPLPCTLPPVRAQGKIRVFPEDFQVVEILGFPLTGEGEHVWLQIRKRGLNTEWVARQLAQFCGIKMVDVGYAGLKDRHAVTTQWFSLRLKQQPEPVWAQLNSQDLSICQIFRHHRKLRRGGLKSNQFKLIIRGIQGDGANVDNRLQRIRQQGIPNYFGEQRFGHKNLTKAEALLTGKLSIRNPYQKQFYYGVIQAFLFNLILTERVQGDNWQWGLAGDVMQLNGSHRVFTTDSLDSTLLHRLANLDIHPAAPLWGKGKMLVQGAAAELQSRAIADYKHFCRALEQLGLKLQWRALRIKIENLQWQWLSATELQLVFELPSGGYATALLSQVLMVENAQSLRAGDVSE